MSVEKIHAGLSLRANAKLDFLPPRFSQYKKQNNIHLTRSEFTNYHIKAVQKGSDILKCTISKTDLMSYVSVY